jgi:hypothetical protein
MAVGQAGGGRRTGGLARRKSEYDVLTADRFRECNPAVAAAYGQNIAERYKSSWMRRFGPCCRPRWWSAPAAFLAPRFSPAGRPGDPGRPERAGLGARRGPHPDRGRPDRLAMAAAVAPSAVTAGSVAAATLAAREDSPPVRADLGEPGQQLLDPLLLTHTGRRRNRPPRAPRGRVNVRSCSAASCVDSSCARSLGPNGPDDCRPCAPPAAPPSVSAGRFAVPAWSVPRCGGGSAAASAGW